MAGDWMIGGVSFSETLAAALGLPHVVGVAEGISRARYYPGVEKLRVKLLAEPARCGSSARRWSGARVSRSAPTF
jgi:NADH oxidase (H2O2-forming)